MNPVLTNRIDRLFGIAGTSPAEIAIIEERLAILQPRMPWLYAMMLSCQVGMVFTFQMERHPPLVVIIVGLLTALRGAKWLSLRREIIVGEAARRRLRSIGLASLVTSGIFMVVIAQFLPGQPLEKRQLMMVMTATCTIALAMPLSALPSSARLTYILFGIPAAVVGTIAGNERAAAVASFNLLLVNIILIALLKLQDRSFVAQVNSRLKGEADRDRAEHAEQIAIEERTLARAMAETDFLTGLANRRAFLAALQRRTAGMGPSSVLLLDLDGFKPVNDTFGHDVGDELLKFVGDRLRQTQIVDATVARLGGDEFAILVPDVVGEAALLLGRRIVGALSQPYAIGDVLVSVSACCGIALMPAGESDTSAALRNADLALYRAKSQGRAAVEHYSAGLGQETQRRTEIESALRRPGVENEIELLYQPIHDLKTFEIVAFEALARWTHSRLGAIAPADFFPITEQMQLVEAISQALLLRAAKTAKAWRPDQRLSFNLSAVQLCSFGSSKRVLRALHEAGLPPERLQIEVTETAMMADFETARGNLSALQDRGVKVLLDDFGAGYASISYLREMKFDALKLDGSLITASEHAEGARLLKGVIDLARAVGIPCIAEHVETKQQAKLLQSMECEFGQGYWLGRPVDAATAAALCGAPQSITARNRRKVA